MGFQFVGFESFDGGFLFFSQKLRKASESVSTDQEALDLLKKCETEKNRFGVIKAVYDNLANECPTRRDPMNEPAQWTPKEKLYKTAFILDLELN